MSKDRIVFVPWNQADAGKFAGDGDWSNRERHKTHHKRTWTTYFLDSPGTPLADLGMGWSSRLHIFGHGVPPGQDNTKMYGDTGRAPDVTVDDLADMLVDFGLKKRYLGTIVCDVCYSALGTPSFAKQLATAMKTRGYLCPTMGFKGALYPVYFNYAQMGNGHKYAHRIVERLDGSISKSKDAKERFWG